MAADLDEFWTLTSEEAARRLGASEGGLTSSEASARLGRYGRNTLQARREARTFGLFLHQFTSPIILLLLGAAVLAGFLGDPADAVIILVIIAVSGFLGFWQERGAANTVKALLATVAVTVSVRRDGGTADRVIDEIVPGDVVELSAGAAIPGDCLLLDCRDLFLDESALTGETFPVEKRPGAAAANAPLAARTGALFMGTHVISGSGTALVVLTGADTAFGAVSQRLRIRPAETEFERGVRRFGMMLVEVTVMLVAGIFAVNVLEHRPVLDSFLFALALAVGLTPQLLPAIISINLAHGASQMAKQQVIVKRLESIENLGSMNVLCADKTGTLTEGVVRLKAALDPNGQESRDVLFYAFLNSGLETGFINPIDAAIRATSAFDLAPWRKLDEEPYDFVRKRLSILAEGPPGESLVAGGAGTATPARPRRLMVTKGSTSSVLSVCTRCLAADESVCDLESQRPAITALYERLSAEGYRTLGVAFRDDVIANRLERADEEHMTFAGLLALFDPPKRDAAATIEELGDLGVRLKLITGDNAAVAHTLADSTGLEQARVLTGPQLHALSDSALLASCSDTDIFAEVEPNQKERIVSALRRAGNVVGFMGDGINDASALHAADVGISVQGAVDVAKEAAQIVLLSPGLDVLAAGVRSGRTTFANTMKYAFMATSANFGNMFSMAGASIFLPFLPLLPTQILLVNLLTDIPEMTIATDAVDSELVQRPQRWDLRFLREFMVVFGGLSSVFDYAIFGVLLLLLHAAAPEFRTGWFTESVLSASMVVLIIRTRRPFARSRPSWQLAAATAAVALLTLLLPYTPLGPPFRLVHLPWVFYITVGGILAVYVTAAEVLKAVFYRRHRMGASA